MSDLIAELSDSLGDFMAAFFYPQGRLEPQPRHRHQLLARNGPPRLLLFLQPFDRQTFAAATLDPDPKVIIVAVMRKMI